MDRVLNAKRQGGRDADYLEGWVLRWMTPDDLEEHIEETRIYEEIDPEDWDSAFQLIMRLIKTVRIDRDKNAKAR